MDLSRGERVKSDWKLSFSGTRRVELLLTEMGTAAARADLGLQIYQSLCKGQLRVKSLLCIQMDMSNRPSDTMSRSARPPLGSLISLGRLNRTQLWVMAMIYNSKMIQHARFKMPGTKSRGNRVQSSRRPLAVEHTGHVAWLCLSASGNNHLVSGSPGSFFLCQLMNLLGRRCERG